MPATLLLWADQTCQQILTWLAYQTLYASVLLLTILVIRRALPQQALRWHYGVLVLVLVRLVLPPTVAAPWSARQIVGPGAHQWWAAPVAEESASVLTPEAEAFPGQTLLAQLERAWPLPRASTTETKTSRPAPIHRRWTIILVGLWVAGMSLVLLRFVRRRAIFRRIIDEARPVEVEQVLVLTAQWRRRYRLRRTVNVVSSDAYPTAFTLGTRNAYIFLPASLLQTIDHPAMEAVLAHEMAHIKRFDDVFLRLQHVVQSIYFFHPGVWYVNRRMHQMRESLCDEMVVSAGGISPARYARNIIRVLECTAARRPNVRWALASAHDYQSMATRLQHLQAVTPISRKQTCTRWVVVMLIGLFLLPMAPYGRDSQATEAGTNPTRHLPQLMQGWFARKFEPGLHIKATMPEALHPAAVNPNLRSPQTQIESFQTALEKGRRPAIIYDTGGAPVRAAAAGIVHFIGEGRGAVGDAEGFYVRIAHDNYDALRQATYPRVTLYRPQVYRTTYYNLGRVAVQHWQSVKRGQVIGYGRVSKDESQARVQVVLEERGNWVDADQYGLKHGFMAHREVPPQPEIDLAEMNRRLDRQVAIVHDLLGHFASSATDEIYFRIHAVIDTERFKQYPVHWSTLDRFRYLAHRFQEDPSQFPTLSVTEFATLQESFYANQAIVLTLPFD
jgi:beta-lactamase regulating signal transducer with metallopeptidase domain